MRDNECTRDHSAVVTWRYKGGLESAMEQKRIVIDQGSQIQPVDTVIRADPYSSLTEREEKGTKVDRDRKREMRNILKANK